MKTNGEKDYYYPHIANGNVMSSFHIDGTNRGRHTSLEYLLKIREMTEAQAYRYLDDLEARNKKEIEGDGELLNEEFEATIRKNQYANQNGWIEEHFVDIKEGQTFDALLAKYEGKKVKITILEIV